MCRLEQPGVTIEAEPENVLNTASPGRGSSWILASELMTPARPTTGGMQTPTGQPVQYGPNPVTQQYSRRQDLCIPPAQWGDRDLAHEDDDESEGSKPVRIRTYLLERPQKTRTDMYKFAPRSPRL